MHTSIRTILVLSTLVLSFFASSAFANERWYRVELMLIEHKDKSGVSQEEWPLDPGYPQTRLAHYIKSPSDEQNVDNFIEIPKEELDLNQAKDSLKKRTGSKILLHKGWRQLVKEDNPEPVRLYGGKLYHYAPTQNNTEAFDLYEFDGTLTILLSRYLHVDTDLVFHKPMEVLNHDNDYRKTHMQKLKPLMSEADWKSQPNADLQRFRMQEKRKLKKDDVVYIDHPLYGILLKISNDKPKRTS